MDSTHLYQQIVASIRDEIISGVLKPGDRLPAIRKMTEKWQCNNGTILRAYQELARQGLVVSHVGRGTQVASQPAASNHTPLRRAVLQNRTESFLLEVMSAGYAPGEVEESLQMALERWQFFSGPAQAAQPNILRFSGSHDPAIALIAAQYHDVDPRFSIQLTLTGSSDGLNALAENKADVAGCHLWDAATDTYNEQCVRRTLPGKKAALVTLAHRNVGLVVSPGNPLGIKNLSDLTRKDIRFVNRKAGSGVRVWLDAQLRLQGVDPARITGFDDERPTHSEVASTVSKGIAQAGVAVETAALTFGLGFELLTTERYDLVIPEENWRMESVQVLVRWIQSPQTKAAIHHLGGYDTFMTGAVSWVS